MIECNYCLTNPKESYNGKCPNCGAPIENESESMIRWCQSPNEPRNFVKTKEYSYPGISEVEFHSRVMDVIRKQL